MRKNLYILAVMAVMAMAFSPTASASLQLTLSSGASSFTITDGSLLDTNPNAGQITFIGAVGNWSLNVSTGTVGTNPLIDLNSVDTLSGLGTGANALSLTFSSTGYSSPFNAQFLSGIGGTLGAGASLSYSAYVDTNNGLGVQGTQIGSTLNFGPAAAAFTPFGSSTMGGFSPANSLYSLTQVVVISSTRAGTTSFDAAIDAVPEPATVVLLGGVMVATFGAMRRKRNRA